jgi:hypothetical protein
MVQSSGVARTISSAVPRSRMMCASTQRKNEKRRPFSGNNTATDTKTRRFTRLRHGRDRVRRTLLDQRVRTERFGWANTERRYHNVLSLKCACQLVHVVRVASQNLQQRMLAFDLLRRVHERRYFMPSGKPKVDDFSSGVSVGAR